MSQSANLSRHGSSSMVSLASAAAVGTMMGVASLLYMQNSRELNEKEQKLERAKERRRKALEKKMIDEFLEDGKVVRVAAKEGGDAKACEAAAKRLGRAKTSRRVRLCFNENDEMIEKSLDTTEEQKQTPSDEELMKKPLPKTRKYVSEIIVNVGDREYDVGKPQVTLDMFDKGKDKVQNCETFIENLERTRKRHFEEYKNMKKTEAIEYIQQTPGDDSMTPMTTEGSVVETPGASNVMLDIDHKTFKKKDHIFMDFFSMYGKNAIKKKKKSCMNLGQQTPLETPTPLNESMTPDEVKDISNTVTQVEIYNKNKFNKYQTKTAKAARNPSPLNRFFEKVSKHYEGQAQAQKVGEARPYLQ